jgi:hypothetical protein
MQKSYLAKSPINFVQFSFRVNAGDILVHDTTNQRLTVYRGGEIVKTMKQSSLGMSALLKDKFAEEIVEARPKPKVVEVPKPKVVEASKPVPQPIAPEETLRMLKNVPKLKPDLPTSPPQKKREEKKRPPIKVEIPEPIVGREE